MTKNGEHAGSMADPDRILTPLTREYWLGRTDLRPLSIFRILLGIVTLYDILRRLEEFTAWHTDLGVLPRAALVDGIARPWRFSVLDMMGPSSMVALFFVFGGIASVCLILGYKTRWATFCCWLFVVSVQERNLGVTDSSDTLYRVMLFWMIFSPAGAAYSIDRALSKEENKAWPPMGSSVALRIMQLELVLVYFITSVAKNGDHWRDGSAVYRMLQVWDFARPTADFIVQNMPWSAKPMAYSSLALEYAMWILLLVPNLNVRKLLLLSAIGFHAGIEATANVGMFSFMMWVTYSVYLWPSACDWIDKRLPSFPGLVRWFENTGMKYLPNPAPYHDDWVGTGRNTAALAVCWVLFGTILAEQPHELNNRISRTPTPFWATMETLSLWQNWRMFAPNPVFDSGPWTAEGITEDGRTVDVLEVGAPGFAHPPTGRWLYSRWNKYRLHVRTPEQRGYLLWLGRYLCRQYNDGRPMGQRLDHYDLMYQLKTSHGVGEPDNPVVPTLMWRHYCIKVPDEKK